MSNLLKRKFTKWYVNQGYKFGHNRFDIWWNCPDWVKPFLCLFSPSVYLVKNARVRCYA